MNDDGGQRYILSIRALIASMAGFIDSRLPRAIAAAKVLVVVGILFLLGSTWKQMVTGALTNHWMITSLHRTLAGIESQRIDHGDFCAAELQFTETNAGSSFTTELLSLNQCFYLQQARLLCLAGKPSAALASLSRAKDACPRTKFSRAVTGDIWYALGDWDQALSEWSAASSIRLLLDRAKRLMALGRDSQTEEVLRLLISNEETMTVDEARQVYETLGYLARNQNKPELVVSAYSKALGFSPERGDYLMWIGIAQRQLGDLSASYGSLSWAVELIDLNQVQTFSWAKAQLGFTLESMGDMKSALDILRETLVFCEESLKCPEQRRQWLRSHVQRLEEENGRQ